MESVSSSCRQIKIEDANEVGETEGGKDELTSLNNYKDLNLVHSITPEEFIPKIGMMFGTEEDAYQFYLAYAKEVGFGVRRSKNRNDKFGKLVDRIFCCSAQGKRQTNKRDINVRAARRPETRFGCKAQMKVSYRNVSGKFSVVQFREEHNHRLSSPNMMHLHKCHRKMTSSTEMQIDMENNMETPPKATHGLVVRPVVRQVCGRENLCLIPDACRSYLRSKRTRDMIIGDAGGVLEYLHKMQFDDPNFFHAIQVDEDDLITNIFWSDAKMRSDYLYFGDVVYFDTTYMKNNAGRPLALFVGVNHHKQTILFGVALLFDETFLTFEWLFDTFAGAMSDKRPETILTDQDAAMEKALALRWPETHHRLCIWHIYQNATIHLSGVFSQFKEFASDLSSCIYDFEEEEDFVDAWDEMLIKYGIEDNDWLMHMFGIKEKWALVYGRLRFCGDIIATQRSESMNSVVKRYVTCEQKILEFFDNFGRLVEDCRYKELMADFRSNTSIPSLLYPIEILKHATRVYTLEVFKCFQNEWYKSHDSSIESLGEIGTVTRYEITPYKKRYHHVVSYDSSNGKVECSCRKFDFAGILCCHVLKVFTMKNIMEIPSQYILKRWTRKAKLGFFGAKNSGMDMSNLDPKICQRMRYKELCKLCVELVTKAAESEKTYKIVKDSILKMSEIVDARLQGGDLIQDSSIPTNELNQNEMEMGETSSTVIEGIRMKEKTVSDQRSKWGCLEKASKKRRKSTEESQNPASSTVWAPMLPSNLEVRPGITENLQTTASLYVETHQKSTVEAQKPYHVHNLVTNNSQQSTNVNQDSVSYDKSGSVASFNEGCKQVDQVEPRLERFKGL